MTVNYSLADKMKNQFYERSNAVCNGSSSRPVRGSRRRNGRVRAKSYVREVTYSASDVKRSNSKKTTSAVNEVKVKKKYIPPIFVAVLVVATVMMMYLVMSFSEVYETSNKVSKLEKQLETLKAEESELSLKLSQKNDLREIELLATTKLGMVKEDSLQKRFVSLSEGERIEVLENTEETTETQGGVMLSSILSALGNFFDRFK